MNPNQAVAESLGEQLSALMDGELARDQVRFLLRGVETRPDLARRWSNYHVVSATLKREFVAVALPADFAAAVMGRLDAGSAVAATLPARRVGLGALRWVGGGAIAAAVAVVALTVSRPVQQQAGMAPSLASAGTQAAPRYLPLAPVSTANPVLSGGGEFQQASIESVLPGYYQPNGAALSPGQMQGLRVPYLDVRRGPVQPLQNLTPADAAAGR